ncbi:hypothetical protein GPS54_17765 [Acinetobacter haemolyticus]|nr:hypothetical protein [Acinetobacter haemolyticus]NAR84451.1 hypothetical protein [Acinetobacter haemolyticus]
MLNDLNEHINLPIISLQKTIEKLFGDERFERAQHINFVIKLSVHDKFHRTLVLSGFFFLKIASTFLNSSFFPKPIKRRIAI